MKKFTVKLDRRDFVEDIISELGESQFNKIIQDKLIKNEVIDLWEILWNNVKFIEGSWIKNIDEFCEHLISKGIDVEDDEIPNIYNILDYKYELVCGRKKI